MINNVDKHNPTSDEIDDVIYKMRSCDIDELIVMWNEISTMWTVKSVTQVHKSLADSGHIEKIVRRVKEFGKELMVTG